MLCVWCIYCVGYCIWFSLCVYWENVIGLCDILGYCMRECCIMRIFLLFMIKLGYFFYVVFFLDRFKWWIFGLLCLLMCDVLNNSYYDIEGCVLVWKDVFLRDVWN